MDARKIPHSLLVKEMFSVKNDEIISGSRVQGGGTCHTWERKTMPSYISHQELMEGHAYLHPIKKKNQNLFSCLWNGPELILRLTYGTPRHPERECLLCLKAFCNSIFILKSNANFVLQGHDPSSYISDSLLTLSPSPFDKWISYMERFLTVWHFHIDLFNMCWEPTISWALSSPLETQ